MAAPAQVQRTGQPIGARPAPAINMPGRTQLPQQTRNSIQPSTPKPFDINIYFKAVGLFFNDFFGKKIPYFFQNIGPVLSNAPNWWNKLTQNEQISYAILIFGQVLLITGVVLFFVL